MKLYLDISPLLEARWTGLAVVTKNLAKHLLSSMSDNVDFFVDNDLIAKDFVERSFHAPGGYLQLFVENGAAVSGSLRSSIKAQTGKTVGIFPNIKTIHRAFDHEILIVHDLTFMLCPEFHTPGTVALYNAALQRDLASSDLVCCVSEATRQDLLTYTGFSPARTFVSHEGADDFFPPPEEPPTFEGLTEDYIVVLGTVEPRKNLKLIADFLRSHPWVLEKYTLAIVGRPGWGPRFDAIFGDDLSSFIGSKILFTGFISNGVKRALFRSARFSIFPSIMEGFGLPVVESMGEGCPVLASASSSLLELNVPAEWQFDPLSVDDFATRFSYADSLSDSALRQIGQDLRTMVRSAFKWESFTSRIVKAAAAL